jgi:hypothetical protein
MGLKKPAGLNIEQQPQEKKAEKRVLPRDTLSFEIASSAIGVILKKFDHTLTLKKVERVLP